jgi:hypothetical protein
MTSNDDNSGPPPRDVFLRHIREVKYAQELAGKVALQTSRPGEFQLDNMEECAWHWERFKTLAFTSGALAGFAALAVTRKSTTLICRRFGRTISFNQVTICLYWFIRGHCSCLLESKRMRGTCPSRRIASVETWPLRNNGRILPTCCVGLS